MNPIIKVFALLLGVPLGLIGCFFHGAAWLFYTPAVKLLRYGLAEPTQSPHSAAVEFVAAIPEPVKPPEG